MFIFQQSFRNTIALTYVRLLAKSNVSSKQYLFYLIYYNFFEYVAPCYVALRKLYRVVVIKIDCFHTCFITS